MFIVLIILCGVIRLLAQIEIMLRKVAHRRYLDQLFPCADSMKMANKVSLAIRMRKWRNIK